MKFKRLDGLAEPICQESASESCESCGLLQQQIVELTSCVAEAREVRDRVLTELEEMTALETSLREKTQALVRSNQELDQFASVAAHDLQEPLHSILVFLDLLRVKCGNRLDANGLSIVNRVRSAAIRMQEQIQGLLVYSRLDAPSSQCEMVPLGPLCEDIIASLQGKIEEFGGAVVVQELPAIQGDSIHFRQLFQNLIQNGLKFHRPGQPPMVKVSGRVITDRRWRGAGPPRRLCQVDISDQGIGIPSEYHHKIFDMFQRLHRKDEYAGVGIGLALCQRIVNHYGGEIVVHSEIGHGSIFTVTLPEYQKGLE